jgi:hypothetical protein
MSGILTPREKRLGREAGHSPHSSFRGVVLSYPQRQLYFTFTFTFTFTFILPVVVGYWLH